MIDDYRTETWVCHSQGQVLGQLSGKSEAAYCAIRNRIPRLFEAAMKFPIRQFLEPGFRCPLPAQRLEPERLVAKQHFPAQLVLDQVAGQDLRLGDPWFVEHMSPPKTVVSGLAPQLLQGPQPGVAPGLDDVVLLAGPASDRQWIVEPALSLDGFLDYLELCVLVAPGVALVAPDQGYLQQKLSHGDWIARPIQRP